MAQYITPVVILLSLGGCATAARQEFVRIKNSISETQSTSKACVLRVLNKEEYLDIQNKVSFVSNNSHLSYLKNKSFPTKEELNTFSRLEEDLNQCEDFFAEGMRVANPLFGIVASACKGERNQITVSFLAGKTSWGSLNEQFRANREKCNLLMLQAAQKVEGDLTNQNQIELQDRARMSAALRAAGQQLQQQPQQTAPANNYIYNTGGNCPVGFFPWTDQWGNSVCKSF